MEVLCDYLFKNKPNKDVKSSPALKRRRTACGAFLGMEVHAVPPETIIYGNIADEESRLEAKAAKLPATSDPGFSPPRYRACDPVGEQRVGVVAGASVGQPSGADLSSTRS
ncbi:MAG: hypothetical protein QOK26_2177, partial [Pseudonocardiales bacterium]|nr:hypothetical protein [Pseudonocardiales bacterium]